MGRSTEFGAEPDISRTHLLRRRKIFRGQYRLPDCRFIPRGVMLGTDAVWRALPCESGSAARAARLCGSSCARASASRYSRRALRRAIPRGQSISVDARASARCAICNRRRAKPHAARIFPEMISSLRCAARHWSIVTKRGPTARRGLTWCSATSPTAGGSSWRIHRRSSRRWPAIGIAGAPRMTNCASKARRSQKSGSAIDWRVRTTAPCNRSSPTPEVHMMDC